MSDNPAKILVNTSGIQVGTVSNPLYLSSSLASTFVINNYQTIAPSGSAGLQGPTGSAGPPCSNASGTWRDPGNTFVTTGSVSIDSQDRTASQIGSDVFFFVSGSKDVPSGATRKVTVFGGDITISGSLTNLSGISGSLQKTSGGLSYLVAGDSTVINFASNGQATISFTTGSVTTTVATGTWRDPGNTFVTTGSVSIDTGNRTASQIGSDVFLYVSGTINVPSGTNRKVSLFDGDTVNSGTIFLGNLTTRPTVAPVSGCIIYSYGGDVYRFMSTGHHQALGEKYVTITMPTASNYTMTVDEYTATTIYLNTTAATMYNLYVPIVSDYKWIFYLSLASTSNGIQVIGITGTGVVVQYAGYSKTLFADGTNIQQISTGFDATS